MSYLRVSSDTIKSLDNLSEAWQLRRKFFRELLINYEIFNTISAPTKIL